MPDKGLDQLAQLNGNNHPRLLMKTLSRTSQIADACGCSNEELHPSQISNQDKAIKGPVYGS